MSFRAHHKFIAKQFGEMWRMTLVHHVEAPRRAVLTWRKAKLTVKAYP